MSERLTAAQKADDKDSIAMGQSMLKLKETQKFVTFVHLNGNPCYRKEFYYITKPFNQQQLKTVRKRAVTQK